MRLKALAALCKRDGAYCLYDRIGEGGEVIEQWLGPRGACFPLSGLPHLDEDNLIAMFDITEKQQEKIYIHRSQLPATLSFEHTDDGETMLDREMITLGYGGRVVRPLITRGGLEFINDDYLSPLADVADELEIYERHTTDGQAYFAAKMGLMLVGVIMPLNIIEDKLVENMETLAVRCRTALESTGTAKAEERQRNYI